MTRVIRIRKSPGGIKQAAMVIRKGGLVAFPTETVYGLGANALDPKAVRKIFAAKGRPADNPVIVHISRKEDVYALAEVTETAETLIDEFWPGPLTLILRKSGKVPKITTSGLDTVAVRMPSNKVALALIDKSGVPVAAPSANAAGKPSATSASHVLSDLENKADIILDGGRTKEGIESTVIDVTSNIPVLLRPGAITLEEIEDTIGKVRIIKKVGGSMRSPGMKYRHYSPDAQLIMVKGSGKRKRLAELKNGYEKKGMKVFVIDFPAEKLAKNLFAKLREFDKRGADVILVAAVSEKGIGLAVMNRLRKAASRTL